MEKPGCRQGKKHHKAPTSSIVLDNGRNSIIRRILWDHFHPDLREVLCERTNRTSFKCFQEAVQQHKTTLLEWTVSDYSQLETITLLSKDKNLYRRKLLPTVLFYTFKHLNLPLPLLSFSLPTGKKIHWASCHHAASRENRFVVIKILNYTFYVIPKCLGAHMILPLTTEWQKGTVSFCSQ